MANDDSDNFLKHYGVPGMRWGKRKATVEVNKTEVAAGPTKAHLDAVTSSGYKSRVAAGGVAALSTKELQTLVNRQNLEQQYERLNPAPVSAGKQLMGTILPSVGKLGYAAYRAYYPAPAPPPMSTDLRVTSGRQKAGDMLLTFGKEAVKAHGLEIGMAIVKSLL